MKKSISIIDCSVKDPAYTCFNRLVRELGENLSYHNFPKYGTESFQYEAEPDGIIALGSHSNLGDGSLWHEPLKDYLLEKLNQGIPVFGICFSHQLMAHAFNSTLIKNPLGKCLEGVREVEFSEELFGIKEKTLSFFTAHNYQIGTLGPELKVIGKAPNSPFEFIKHASLPYYSCQSHPEGSEFFIKQEIGIELKSGEKQKGLQDGLLLLKKFILSV